MEYLHRRKEAPMQGMTGLWGGGSGSLMLGQSAPGDPLLPYEGTAGKTLPLTGGENWFSNGHYGYEDSSPYTFPAGKTLKQLYYHRLQDNAYQWWFIAWERNNGTNFTLRYGARIAVPDGEGTDQEGPWTLANFEET